MILFFTYFALFFTVGSRRRHRRPIVKSGIAVLDERRVDDATHHLSERRVEVRQSSRRRRHAAVPRPHVARVLSAPVVQPAAFEQPLTPSRRRIDDRLRLDVYELRVEFGEPARNVRRVITPFGRVERPVCLDPELQEGGAALGDDDRVGDLVTPMSAEGEAVRAQRVERFEHQHVPVEVDAAVRLI